MIKRSAKPKAKSSTVAKNRAFAIAVLERDEHQCKMFMKYNVYSVSGSRQEWWPCQNLATDASHVFSRRDCGKAKYDPNVAVASCRNCHDLWHAGNGSVKFSLGAIQRARKAIAACGNRTALKRREK